jgi:N-acetylmuramic acid 6-phosphate etherase
MTERIHEAYADFDTWPMERRIAELVDANERAVRAVQAARPALTRAAEAIAERLLRGGRLVYAGAGTSGRLAVQDAAELPPTFAFERTLVLIAGGSGAGAAAREDAEDDAAAAAAAVDDGEVGPDDALLALAASGRTPYTVAAARRARERGACTVGITNNDRTPLLEVVAIPVLLDTGPEVVAGSTRMVAGTAQKIALNVLSTAPMVELGALYGNLMVAMRPKNEKLRRRAAELVHAATGAERAVADQVLQEAAWDMRVAIVMLRRACDATTAREALARHGMRVREAVEALARGR